MKKYAYCIDDEHLSFEFGSIKETCEGIVSDYYFDDWEINKDEKGEFILVDIVETIDYEDTIDCNHFIEVLVHDACNEINENMEEWYLQDININDFELAINEFWKNYKKTRNIETPFQEKSGTKKTYKLYIKEREYGYEFVSYELVGD